MNKSIYEEALLKLKEIAYHLTRKQWLEMTSNIELIREHLQQAQKQEKLLELYKELAMFLTTAVEDDEDTHAYTFANINNLKEQILELENDK